MSCHSLTLCTSTHHLLLLMVPSQHMYSHINSCICIYVIIVVCPWIVISVLHVVRGIDVSHTRDPNQTLLCITLRNNIAHPQSLKPSIQTKQEHPRGSLVEPQGLHQFGLNSLLQRFKDPSNIAHVHEIL